jgi:amino acid adenylation domain-containing protein
LTGTELIAKLRRSGVEVRAENGELRLNAPKGILTSDIRALLLQHKAEILAILEQESAEREAAEIPVLGPRDRNAQLLQSFAQQRLWFLHQLDPLTHTYNMTPAFLLRGPLDPELMERCLNEILRRHEVLRTRLASVDGVAVQKVEQDCSLHLSRLDLSDTPEAERWSTARHVLSEHAQHPFALADELLIRAVLIRLAPEEHVLGLVVHHGVFDGWSVGVLLAELSELYPAFEAGRASPLPDLTLQYGDYSTWQRDWLEGGELERQGQFWADHLGGSLSALDLPVDRARPPFFTGHGATFPWDIDEDVVRGLSALGRKEHATLFMVLLAAFGVVLYRYSRNPDIIIGTPVANRNHAELEGLIGLFANTLALRIDLSGQPSFRELLRRVRASCIGAYGHADMPFERIVQDLQVERDPSRTPVFQAMLGLEGTGERRANLGKVVVTEFDTEEDVARADLSVWLRPCDGGLSGSVEYCTDLFELETMRRVILSFETLLRQVVADPDKPIDQIDLLDSTERHRLVQEWNSTERALSVSSALSRISDQSAADPARVAVSTGGGEQLSYGALWELSGRVASHLVSQGVEQGSIVGVSVSRSPDMLAALLGIWRAGAAYLPLDPEFPEDRLAFMVADSKASYIVTDGQETVPETQAHLIDIGSIPSSADDSELPQIEGDDLAYVIYTSGSTGQPKGVEVTHLNLANFIQSMSKEPGLDEDAVLCAVTTLSFDIAGLELWLPLWVGARVVLADEEQSRDGEWLSELLTESGATVMQATPATWRMLLDAGWEGGLKQALCGGEAFPQDLVAPLLERADEVWNLYGPTETTVWSTAYRVEHEPEGSVPIGRPIDNTRVYVVDEHGALQPPGAPGELWIGGLGVTPGYHDRSELTAERFLPSPFVDGDRVYRTGDLVRWRSDGLLEHLGRMDQQVKVHGFRIELGEIETALAAHDAVHQAVATVHGNGTDARLVGHVVLEDGADVLGSELRTFLSTRLPVYMVPGLIMELDELPLTPNGKVDRKALPNPLESVAQREFVAPRTELEKQIADIWCRLLEVERVGVHDNFFELGGHSLLAIRAVALMSAESGCQVEPRSVFFQSLSQLASSLDG